MTVSWQGSWVALVTPFLNGEVDYDSLSSLIEWHKANGTQGLVVLGTTGEATTIQVEERLAIMRFVAQELNGDMPWMVGTGTNDTASTIQLSAEASSHGADALLVVTPYYNKPSQLGLVKHYTTLASQVQSSIILYNVPGRTGCDLGQDAVIELASLNNIVGLKDATGDLSRLDSLKRLDNFLLYSGDDASACEFMLQGGDGVISVTANVCPASMSLMCKAALKGDQISARGYNQSMIKLHDDLFVEGNPVPVKWLLAHLKRIRSGELRMPLVELSDAYHDLLRNAWQLAEAEEMSLEND